MGRRRKERGGGRAYSALRETLRGRVHPSRQPRVPADASEEATYDEQRYNVPFFITQRKMRLSATSTHPTHCRRLQCRYNKTMADTVEVWMLNRPIIPNPIPHPRSAAAAEDRVRRASSTAKSTNSTASVEATRRSSSRRSRKTRCLLRARRSLGRSSSCGALFR